MTEERAKRKLSAILSADVKGYSRLMQEDELVTIRTLEDYRALMAEVIRKYRGRVVDSPGDNVLAEFASVVDAVESAVEIQKELKAKNAERPENRRMEFRIGINLGDVVEEGERIYGDGVNIAARIEGLAEGGGICISRGEHSVKNIAEPVRVYRVLMEPEAAGKVIGEEKLKPRQWRWAAIGGVVVLILVAGALAIWNFYLRPPFERALVERMAFPLPDKPSIAVLPFVNMSGDPQQDYFSDGLSDQIITALSKVPHLFVIARNSTFTYKGKSVKVQKVAEDLGVRYVLEGSVQRTTDRIRIIAQLIDATKGHHLWAERYDRPLKDVFVIQDEITMEILKALQVKLTTGDKAKVMGKGTDNLDAYQKCLQAVEEFQRFSREGNILARQLCEEAIALDPEYPSAYRILGWTHFTDAAYGWSKSRRESFKKAVELAQKTLALDDTQAAAHSLLSMIYLFQRQYDRAIAEGERAVSISPNGANFNAILALILNYTGRPKEAIEYVQKAMRLSPIYPAWFLHRLGMAYRLTGRYDEAIEALKRFRERNPEHIHSYTELAIAYGQSGRMEDASALVEKLLNKHPKFSLKRYAKTRFFRDRTELEIELAALGKAGLPETPPLPLPDKPSIAVLAFTNMSGDPEQEYLSDGISEEIITALSKTPKLFVIARNSSFTYKGKPVKVQRVGRELGVRYVLEGSVRKAGNKVRITAQLVDAKTGNHLWAERYDRELKDIFALQDEITMRIITALQVKLTVGEAARVRARSTNNLEAYLLYRQAVGQQMRFTKEGVALSRQIAEKAIALDSKFAAAYHIVALSYWLEVPLGLTKDPRQSISKAMEFAQKSLALDKSSGSTHSLLGWLYTVMRRHDKGISECERGVALEPNSAWSHYFLGNALRYAGRHKEAIITYKDAIRLNPIPPSIYYQGLANSYCLTGQYEEAITAGKKAIHIEPNNQIAHAFLAVAFSLGGREEEAHLVAKEVLRINPKFSVDYWAKTIPYKNPGDRELIISSLLKAGLK
jgi:adenylate cyclase